MGDRSFLEFIFGLQLLRESAFELGLKAIFLDNRLSLFCGANPCEIDVLQKS